ncbi:unnamed protein product [Rotaria magnacalcarata]|uniref:Cyclic nucleotide-binding domain-containing protein n=1 Tax=Rotaria magnacalcarata TaxID=392030 RepID=A0A816D3S7_9BILA|nr:unnamed protein product [Rotaria magnacalcarata]CAF1632070.1 unnamed protein product [Rotaria magnacalcarata]CAF2123489.1 unnamed protein product [Rotaria magnacalcarata]CAF2135062.1 unnamed protein product [Rotaria magnacalcarata]
MALNYETLIRAASKPPGQRTTTEINDFIFPWLKQSLKKKQGIFQKISDDVIHDICKTITLERRPAWDVVIHQGDPGDTFYIILQGSVNIYRFDEDGPKPAELEFDTVSEFTKLDSDPEKREELIAQAFGNYIVTLAGGFDFGERALVTNEPRSATVMTIIPTDLLVVGREVFSRTLKAAHEKELQEKTDFINRCPLFSSWAPRLKRLVSLSLERGRFSYDSALYKQGTRADAVYFIWSGEVKITMDPLLHWLQYPNLLPQADPMKQRALELFLPMFQRSQPTNVHIPTVSSTDMHRESFAIKRRHMTFAEAEKERAQRILQLVLLTTGDIVGLEAYVCDLATHMNAARCTAPCDLFYILKHNFVRLQKRHGAQGLGERLREMVLLSLQAYPTRIIHLPLYTSLLKRQLAPPITDDQTSYHTKQSWLLHTNNTAAHPRLRRSGTTMYVSGKDRFMGATTDSRTDARSSRSHRVESSIAIKYVTKDQICVEKLEDRLKKWHSQMGDDSKAQIRPLTRFHVPNVTPNDIISTLPVHEKTEARSNGIVVSASLSGDGDKLISPLEQLLVNVQNAYYQPISTFDSNISKYPSNFKSPPIQIYSKQELYEEKRAKLKIALRNFYKRSVPTYN